MPTLHNNTTSANILEALDKQLQNYLISFDPDKEPAGNDKETPISSLVAAQCGMALDKWQYAITLALTPIQFNMLDRFGTDCGKFKNVKKNTIVALPWGSVYVFVGNRGSFCGEVIEWL